MRAAWLLVIAACGGSGTGGGNDSGNRSDSANVDGAANQSAQQFCVSETNRYRTTVPPPGTGSPRPPLAESSALEQYATTGAMVDAQAMSPHSHFTATNGGGIAFAENECPGWLGWHLSSGQTLSQLVGQCLAAFYGEGPGGGHYENMMNASYTKLGCGFYEDASMNVTITQDYGN